MNDLAKQKLHGPVATLRTETDIWDLESKAWEPARYFIITSFLPSGRISTSNTHNANGSIAHQRYLYDTAGRLTERHTWLNEEPIHRTVYFYDEAGRPVRTAHLRSEGTQVDSEICTYDPEGKMTKVIFLHLPDPLPHRDEDGGLVAHSIGYSIEGMDVAFNAPGASSITTVNDVQNLPVKVIFHDQAQNSLKEVCFERDASGRVLSIETLMGESPFKDLVDRVPLEQREAMTAVLSQAFGRSFSRIAYVYDSRGRVLERTHSMGTLKEDRTTYRYDDLHDEPLAETTEDTSRTANIDDDGVIHYDADKVNIQHTRFEYIYDEYGNWTERTVSYQSEPNPDFQLSNIERRTITYHAA